MATSLASSTELATALAIQLSSLSSLITEDGYTCVCDQTAQELGWSYPMTNPTQVFWMIKRATRHAMELLRIAASSKFKYKTINLQHKFDHFSKMIEDLDREFEKAMASDLGLFSGVESYKMFGTKIDAGFAYNHAGEEITYDIDRLVDFSPKENDA